MSFIQHNYSREGVEILDLKAVTASTRNSRGFLLCNQQVRVAVNNREVRTVPLSLLFSKHILRHWTAGLMTLSARLFVGSTPSWSALGGNGRGQALRISVVVKKAKAKLLYLLNQIKQYVPFESDNCNAFG